MNHPLEFIPSTNRRAIFLTFFVWAMVMTAVMQNVGTPLKTSAAPSGIVSFELAGTATKAGEILASWNPTQTLYAAFGLGVDYLYMPSYALAIALAVLLTMTRHKGWFVSLGVWVGWGSLVAALFDATENFALWKILLGNVQSMWPMIAAVCATIKFALILLGLGYAILGGILPKRRPEPVEGSK